MKLYSVNYSGPLTNDEWSIVTIHKSFETAQAALDKYETNNKEYNIDDYEYVIYEIDTDIDSDVIYDYDNVSTNSSL